MSINNLPNKLKSIAESNANLFFVQIGANDGKRADPIHYFVKKYNWRGLLVEPVREYFKVLKDTYRNYHGMKFANIAISRKSGYSVLYGASKKAPFWVRYLARTLNSFSKETVLSHSWYIPLLRKYVIGEKVRCLTLDALFKKFSVDHVNLMVIDTEGYDFEIIKQINFDKIPPDVLYYEHKHLSPQDQISSWNLLNKFGYKVEHDQFNTFARRSQN